jgi:hypothetical protein
VFRPDKYPINMKKDQINFLFKIWNKKKII